VLKLFNETPAILLQQHVVWFSKHFPERLREKYWRVVKNMQLNYERAYIISENGTYDIDISDKDKFGLYPTMPETLYEILWGFQGESIRMYPMIPADRYYLRLEAPKFRPDPAHDIYRYVDGITEIDTPLKTPRLRIHTVLDLEPLIMRFYNDNIDDQKVLIRMFVNRCSLAEIPTPTPEEKKIARLIYHPDDVREEFGGA